MNSSRADAPSTAEAALPPRRRTRLRRWIVVLASLAFACAATEGLLRYALFGQSRLAERLGRSLRREALFATPESARAYKLQWLLHRDEVLATPGPDLLLGWSGPVSPGAYVHRDEGTVGARTPVLLYGDSNAQCMTPAEDCFQGLMARSELGATHALVNFGVGGYGLDQIYLMLRATLDRYADRQPVVVVSLLLDDDLARSLLDFRCWPKPRFRLEGGRLVEPEPVELDPERFLEQHPPGIASYAWQLLVQRIAPEPKLDFAELRALNRALLEAIRAELEARQLRYFFFLFSFDSAIQGAPLARASREIVLEFLHDHRVPYVDLLDFVRAICDPEWKCLDQLIGRNDPVLHGHYNDAGNRLAFEALRQGLEGRFGAFDFDRVRSLAEQGTFRPDVERTPPRPLLGFPARCVTRASVLCARWDEKLARGPLPRLALRVADDRGTRLDVEVQRGPRSARARVHAISTDPGSIPGAQLRLVVRRDGDLGKAEEFRPGDPARTITWDLAGVERLSWMLTAAGEGRASTWLLLEDLVFE